MKNFLRFAAFAAMAITMGLTAVSCDGDDEDVDQVILTPAEFSIDPTSYDFDELTNDDVPTEEGGHFGTATFTVTNKGQQELKLTSFEISGDGAAYFSTDAEATTVKAGETYSFDVTTDFGEGQNGTYSAVLTIQTNDGEQTVDLAVKYDLNII